METLIDLINDTIYSYDMEYAEKQGISVLTDNDIKEIKNELLNNIYFKQIVEQSIEQYASFKKHKLI